MCTLTEPVAPQAASLESTAWKHPGVLRMSLGPAGPRSPLPEFLEEDAVRETLAADADALQDTVAAQLV